MRWVSFVFILFSLISCSGKGKTPSGIIKPVKMQAVLKDLFLADAVNMERINKDTALRINTENRAYYERIFQLHKISQKEFEKSYAYYLAHPDQLKKIADSLMTDVNRMSTEVYSDTSKRKFNGSNFKDSARQNRD
jgi:hypothetical protein